MNPDLSMNQKRSAVIDTTKEDVVLAVDVVDVMLPEEDATTVAK